MNFYDDEIKLQSLQNILKRYIRCKGDIKAISKVGIFKISVRGGPLHNASLKDPVLGMELGRQLRSVYFAISPSPRCNYVAQEIKVDALTLFK